MIILRSHVVKVFCRYVASVHTNSCPNNILLLNLTDCLHDVDVKSVSEEDVKADICFFC